MVLFEIISFKISSHLRTSSLGNIRKLRTSAVLSAIKCFSHPSRDIFPIRHCINQWDGPRLPQAVPLYCSFIYGCVWDVKYFHLWCYIPHSIEHWNLCCGAKYIDSSILLPSWPTWLAVQCTWIIRHRLSTMKVPLQRASGMLLLPNSSLWYNFAIHK